MDLQRDARRHDAHPERIVAGVDDDLVASDLFALLIERDGADLSHLRHVAEVEIERVRRLPLGHDLLAVEVELHGLDIGAIDDRVDVLDSAEEIISKRHDAQTRRVSLDVVFQLGHGCRSRLFLLALLRSVLQLRHSDALFHDGLGARVGVHDLDPGLIVAGAEEAIDHRRELFALHIAGVVEAVTIILEKLIVLEHLACDVEAVELRPADVLQSELRSGNQKGHLRVGAGALLRREADVERRRERLGVRIGDDHGAQDLVHVFLVDLRRLEDFVELHLVHHRLIDRLLDFVAVLAFEFQVGH